MTGSAADADDLVQDTFTQFLECPPADQTRDVKPWLTRVAINLSRDHLRQRRRQAYLGPWLPSPVETEGFARSVQPEARYSELESASMAFLVALEALSSSQRAVLILRDVLGLSVEETAQATGLREANVKTTHHRARARLESYEAERTTLTPELQAKTQATLLRFMLLLTLGDVDSLKTMLAEDACARNDSNGEFLAARVPVRGHTRIITFHRKVQRGRTPLFAVREINGLPAIVGQFARHAPDKADRFVFSVALDRQGLIRYLDTIVATRKLSHLRFTF